MVQAEASPPEDTYSSKALPPPDGRVDEKDVQEEMKEMVSETKEQKNAQDGDLLNLDEYEQSTEEHGNRLALALFDDYSAASAAPPTAATPWEAFKDSSGDWETDLVQTVIHLSNQKALDLVQTVIHLSNQMALLPEGLDTMALDGMYQHGAMNQLTASSGFLATGSASSVAYGSAGKLHILALPAPPNAASGVSGSYSNADPFAASVMVAPPSYVQMWEIENKHRLLTEEQVVWQQYARDGMQGQAGMSKVQYQCNTGVYTRAY